MVVSFRFVLFRFGRFVSFVSFRFVSFVRFFSFASLLFVRPFRVFSWGSLANSVSFPGDPFRFASLPTWECPNRFRELALGAAVDMER